MVACDIGTPCVRAAFMWPLEIQARRCFKSTPSYVSESMPLLGSPVGTANRAANRRCSGSSVRSLANCYERFEVRHRVQVRHSRLLQIALHIYSQIYTIDSYRSIMEVG